MLKVDTGSGIFLNIALISKRNRKTLSILNKSFSESLTLIKC